MRQVSLGSLEAIIVPAEQADPEVQSPLWTVLLHGFGAPATDLVGLTRALGPLPGVVFVYPGALHSLGYGFGEGRAWWPIDFNDLDECLLEDVGPDQT